MSVDRGQLRALIRDLGAVPPAAQKEMRPAVLKASRPVLAQMRENASWSTRIPPATTMRAASNRPGVNFRVNSVKAPHARPYEGLSGDPFRAPLWGDREHWYPHAARPFFYRAVRENADEVAKSVGDALMGVAERHGF